MVAEFISSQALKQLIRKDQVAKFSRRRERSTQQILDWLVGYAQKRSYLDNYALPGYFLLTGRHGLQLIDEPEGSFPVCQHPNLEERLLIFPPIGSAKAISNYLHQLESWPRNGIQLARVPLEDQASMLSTLRKDWDIIPYQEDLLDWGKYPVRSLPVKAMALREGKAYKNHRRKYNCAHKKVEKLEIIETWNREKNEQLETFLSRWAQKKYANDSSFSLDDYIAPYLKIVSMHANTDIHSICLLFEDQCDGIMGVVVVEILNGVAAAYMNIGIEEISYFPAYILMRTCEFLYENHLADVLCLGGCELEGLDKFKSDLQPASARADSHLSYHLDSFFIKPLSTRRLYT